MALAQVELGGRVFRVEVAELPEHQQRGLGGRRALAQDAGMLFVYPEREKHSFWMKDMFIPIDIIWLDNQRVVHIEHRVPPPRRGTDLGSLPTYSPPLPANFVLEIAAGLAEQLKIRVGQRARISFSGG